MALTGVNLVFLFGVLLIVILLVFGTAIAVKGYFENRRSPVVEAAARVVAKRSKVSGGGPGPCSYASTSYFVTFEDEFGDRREWEMPEEQYGLLVEGDKGTLTIQGEWFKGFTRNSKKPKGRRAG